MVAFIEGRAAFPPEGVVPSFSFLHSHRTVKESRVSINSFNQFLSDHKKILYCLNIAVGFTGAVIGYRGVVKPIPKSFPFQTAFSLSSYTTNWLLIIEGQFLLLGFGLFALLSS